MEQRTLEDRRHRLMVGNDPKLLPVSFALVGPVSGLLGARTTLIAAGVGAGGILILALALLPGLRDIDRAEPDGATVQP